MFAKLFRYFIMLVLEKIGLVDSREIMRNEEPGWEESQTVDGSRQEVTAEAGTEAAARSGSTEKERRTYVPETTVHEETQRAGSTVIPDPKKFGLISCHKSL